MASRDLLNYLVMGCRRSGSGFLTELGWKAVRGLWTKGSMALTAVLLGGLLALGAGGAARAVELVDSFRDWNVYVHAENGQRICYIASVPTKKEGDYQRRGAVAAFVSKQPKPPPNEEVSITPGYSYQPDRDVEVVIGEERFDLFTEDEHAWAKTSADDGRIIEAMRRGISMAVRGVSTKGTYSLDTFSLLGFTDAFNRMQQACPNNG